MLTDVNFPLKQKVPHHRRGTSWVADDAGGSSGRPAACHMDVSHEDKHEARGDGDRYTAGTPGMRHRAHDEFCRDNASDEGLVCDKGGVSGANSGDLKFVDEPECRTGHDRPQADDDQDNNHAQ